MTQEKVLLYIDGSGKLGRMVRLSFVFFSIFLSLGDIRLGWLSSLVWGEKVLFCTQDF